VAPGRGGCARDAVRRQAPAVVPRHTEWFAANITVSGYRCDGANVGDIADESVRRLRQGAGVRVANRGEVGSRRARGVTQLLNLSTTYQDQPLELVQHQVYLSLRDIEDASKLAVVGLVLTCTPKQYRGIFDDFARFVRTVRPTAPGLRRAPWRLSGRIDG
jgi:hypothetical protein